MRFMLVVCLALACAACVTSPVPYSEATPVPADRVLAPSLLVEKPQTAKVSVTRDGGIVGSMCSIRISLNANAVATIEPSERVDLFLHPGEHIIEARFIGICGMGAVVEHGVRVAAGDWKRFRVMTDRNGVMQIFPTTF